MPYLGIGNQIWKEITMEFTPTQVDQELKFSSVMLPTTAYMGIDGIRLTTTSDTANDAPVANKDGNTVDEGGTVSGNVLTNDYDPDGDIFEVISNTLPLHGVVTVQKTGEYTYVHKYQDQVLLVIYLNQQIFL